MSTKKLALLLISGVISIVLIYGLTIIVITWPISELSIAKSGVFGDSFGLLTSLFSGLAFAGLIITIMMQKDELSLQREELKLQRSALESQVEELKSMSKYAALDQVRFMLDSALRCLAESGTDTTKPEQFLTSSMPSSEWKVLLESTNPSEVMSTYKIYTEKTGPAETFISSYSSAAKFYLKAIVNKNVNFELPTHEFVCVNKPWLQEVPYLSTYLHSVYQYSELRLNYEPAHKMFMLAFLVATQKATGKPDLVKKESIPELKDYLDKQGKEYPAIART